MSQRNIKWGAEWGLQRQKEDGAGGQREQNRPHQAVHEIPYHQNFDSVEVAPRKKPLFQPSTDVDL